MGPVWLGGECSGKSCARVGSLNYRFSVSEGDKDIEGAEHICAGTDNDSPDAALISLPLGRTFTNALTAAAIGRRQGLLKVGSCLWTNQSRETAISLEPSRRRSALQRLRSLVQPPWKSADELSSDVRSGGPFFWMEMENTNTLAPDTCCALKPVQAGSRASQSTRKDVKCLSACSSQSMIESA